MVAEYDWRHQYELMFSLIQTQMFTCRYVRVCVNIHTYVSLLCQVRKPWSNDTSVAMNTLTTYILVSNIISIKEAELFGEMADSTAQKRYRGSNWKSSFAQSWNNLSKKINGVILDYNWKYKLNLYKTIAICVCDWLMGRKR